MVAHMPPLAPAAVLAEDPRVQDPCRLSPWPPPARPRHAVAQEVMFLRRFSQSLLLLKSSGVRRRVAEPAFPETPEAGREARTSQSP